MCVDPVRRPNVAGALAVPVAAHSDVVDHYPALCREPVRGYHPWAWAAKGFVGVARSHSAPRRMDVLHSVVNPAVADAVALDVLPVTLQKRVARTVVALWAHPVVTVASVPVSVSLLYQVPQDPQASRVRWPEPSWQVPESA
jgi:hypothetical protein